MAIQNINPRIAVAGAFAAVAVSSGCSLPVVGAIAAGGAFLVHKAPQIKEQILKRCFYSKLKKELEVWSGEDRNRLAAAERVLACYWDKSSALDLRGLNLTDLPVGIGRFFQHLEKLDLSNNRFFELPAFIEQLPMLRSLGLRGNLIANEELSLRACCHYELEQELEAWSGEDLNRLTAARRILDCYWHEQTELDLSSLALTDLPTEIWRFFQHLKKLNLSNNQLSELPESIRLQNLEELDLSRNRFSVLPEVIREFGNLTRLNLGYNELSKLSESIGDLQNLQHLCLVHNKLFKLPESIGDLQNLQDLWLAGNHLFEWPSSIARLQNLRYLNLEVADIPEELFYLQPDCEIALLRLPVVVSEKIRERTASKDYQGPYFNILRFVPRTREVFDWTIDDLLNSIYPFQQRPDLSSLTGDPDKEFILRIWLRRLIYTSEQQHIQPDLIERVDRLLRLASQNERFRECFFSIIESATEKCGEHGPLSSIAYLEIAAELAVREFQNLQELSEFLFKYWVFISLERIVDEKMNPYYDPITVYLEYFIKFREKFRLPPIGILDQFQYSDLPDSAIVAAVGRILEGTITDAPWRFLALQPQWQEALAREEPEEWTRISQISDAEDQLAAKVRLTRQKVENFPIGATFVI